MKFQNKSVSSLLLVCRSLKSLRNLTVKKCTIKYASSIILLSRAWQILLRQTIAELVPNVTTIDFIVYQTSECLVLSLTTDEKKC